MSARASFALSHANARANSRPMPLAAPVIATTLSLRSFMVTSSLPQLLHGAAGLLRPFVRPLFSCPLQFHEIVTVRRSYGFVWRRSGHAGCEFAPFLHGLCSQF